MNIKKLHFLMMEVKNVISLHKNPKVSTDSQLYF